MEGVSVNSSIISSSGLSRSFTIDENENKRLKAQCEELGEGEEEAKQQQRWETAGSAHRHLRAGVRMQEFTFRDPDADSRMTEVEG